MPVICTVDRDYVLVVERALKGCGITPTLFPANQSTHYLVEVGEGDVALAREALLERGRFEPDPATIDLHGPPYYCRSTTGDHRWQNLAEGLTGSGEEVRRKRAPITWRSPRDPLLSDPEGRP